jgi:alkylated DNA repair dioxygenase AlkB
VCQSLAGDAIGLMSLLEVATNRLDRAPRAQPRSLYVMTGASRHVWEHSIPPVETPRLSITFRTMAQA